MPTRGQLTPLTIAVLALLAEAPMHAYRMQQLMQERGIGIVVNIRNRSGLRDNIAAPAQEFPLFPAVVSFRHLLSPQDAHTPGAARHGVAPAPGRDRGRTHRLPRARRPSPAST